MVTVVCPVTNLHHIASLQSSSSCNCTSCAGIVSASVISLFAHDSVIPMIWGFISSTIMDNSFFLFIMLLAFKHTHLISALDVFPCIPLHTLSACNF